VTATTGLPVLASPQALELLLDTKYDRVGDRCAGAYGRLDVDQQLRRRHALREELRPGTEHGEYDGGGNECGDGAAHEQQLIAQRETQLTLIRVHDARQQASLKAPGHAFQYETVQCP
jgi:hypothetical protein